MKTAQKIHLQKIKIAVVSENGLLYKTINKPLSMCGSTGMNNDNYKVFISMYNKHPEYCCKNCVKKLKEEIKNKKKNNER